MTETNLHMKSTDEGEENILKTALYMGTVVEGAFEDYDSVLMAYRVYQMEDGTVYLDGTGNGYAGGGFTIHERMEYTESVNGETTKEILDIEFSIKDAERLIAVEVIWFDGENKPIAEETVPLAELESEYDLTPPEGTAWALVQQTDEDETVTRTALMPDSSGRCSHKLIQLDDWGIGRTVHLNWELPQQ